MLELDSRIEVVLTGGRFQRLSDPMTPAEGGQRRIGHIRSTTLQFFMDPDEIAFAGGQ